MSRIWTLEELCHALSHCRREGGPASISGISFDSREVRSGDLFAALPGVQSEGLDYLEQALSRGAVAVLAPSTATLPRDLPALLCDYPAESAGQVAHLLAGNPSRDWPLLAVTGTNGKSSSVFLVFTFPDRVGSTADASITPLNGGFARIISNPFLA